MGIHKGTKLTDKPKCHETKFRYDDCTKMKLVAISESTGMNQSEIIRNGIDIQYEQIKK